MDDFRELVERSRDGMAVSRQGSIIYANPAFAVMLGYADPAELIGKSVASLTPTGDAGSAAAVQAQEAPTDAPTEAMLVHKSGSWVATEVVERSQIRFGGEDGFLVIVRGTAERQRLEGEVLRAINLERERLAHDIHDSLGQELGAISFKARALQCALDEKLPEEGPAAAEIVRYAGDAIAHARALSHGLDPAVEKVGFAELLDKLAANCRRTFRVSCSCELDRTVRVSSSSTAQNLYRIAQEAVNNAIRHGQAKHIDICLKYSGPKLALTIDDDGQGLPDPSIKRPGSGIGIRTMQYRASSMGGICQILPRSPRGASVRCTVPLSSCV